MEGIEIPIGADIKGFQKGVNEVQNELKGLSSTASKSSNGIDNFSKSTNKAGDALGGMAKTAPNATSATMEFSRVIQDAPYGMQGVANNLQQLTANFGHLSKSAGGTIPALKMMLSSLAGPAGILLAVSAVTTAIVYFGNSSQKSAKQAEELAKKQTTLKESLDNYLGSLEAVKQANIRGEQSATKELVTLSLLKSQVNDTTISLNKRKEAVAELRKLYPDYLKNMTDEKILNGGLATVYDTLTGSIKERARATASMNAIIKNTEMILVLESQVAAKNDEITKQKIENEKNLLEAYRRTGKGLGNITFASAEKQRGKSIIAQLTKEAIDLQGEIKKLELNNLNLEGNVKESGGIAKVGDGIIDKIIPKKEVVNERVNALKTNLASQLVGIQDVFNATPLNVLGSTLTQLDIQKFSLLAKLAEMNAEITDIIQNGTMQAFAGIGEAIGSAMAGAGSLASNLGKSLLSTLGSVLTQLGMMAIKIGVGIKAIKIALKSLNPAVAIAAGVGLVALGSFFSNQSAKISETGGGGSNAGGSSGVSSGGGFTGGFSGASGNQRVVFEIAGRKLIGVFQNEIRAQGNSGVNFAF